jgi:hypothetical protein
MDRARGIHRSRRNLITIGAITASALLTNAKAAHAVPGGNGRGRALGLGNGHCFLRGTTIRTADGHRKIEDLAAGDPLPTVFGGIRPIQWIARYRYKKSGSTQAWVKDVLPVRIARSALGPEVPSADLFVSQGHPLLIDDVLVPVYNLINNTTIAIYDACALDELEFFHIKLETHDVIYAEGAPCDTLRHVDEHAVNFAEYLRQYGRSVSEEIPCAPVFGSGRRVEIKSRLRSAISPWFDCRQKLDVIRDKLEEGEPVLRQPECMLDS